VSENRIDLPYSQPFLDDDDVAAVTAVLHSHYLTTGPAVSDFEAEFAAAVGAPYAAACSSGTAALHLTALALGLGSGDLVVVPTLTFLATANSVRLCGAEIIFADVDADTGLMTEATFMAALSRVDTAVRAVYPVHLNGQCVEMHAIRRLAAARDIRVIEDACHALGADYNVTPVGACTLSDMAVFSTHPVKAITTGEGGVVTTRDLTLFRRVIQLRNHGMTRDASEFLHRDLAFDGEGRPHPWYYEMAEPGLNYRASDIHCALGTSQLRKLVHFVARRRELALRYDKLLAPFAPLLRPVPRVPWCNSAFHLYPVLIDFSATDMTRTEVMQALSARGIGTQVHYLPVHCQPYYRRHYGALEMPGAYQYYARVLSLPLFPAMADTDIDRVVVALGEAIPALHSVMV